MNTLISNFTLKLANYGTLNSIWYLMIKKTYPIKLAKLWIKLAIVFISRNESQIFRAELFEDLLMFNFLVGSHSFCCKNLMFLVMIISPLVLFTIMISTKVSVLMLSRCARLPGSLFLVKGLFKHSSMNYSNSLFWWIWNVVWRYIDYSLPYQCPAIALSSIQYLHYFTANIIVFVQFFTLDHCLSFILLIFNLRDMTCNQFLNLLSMLSIKWFQYFFI